nr:unnamed protein product [Callosobruchus analis]
MAVHTHIVYGYDTDNMDYTCNYCRLNFGTEELRDKHHTQCGPSLLIKIQMDEATKNLCTAKMKQINDKTSSLSQFNKSADFSMTTFMLM